jgi:hypothetical protein
MRAGRAPGTAYFRDYFTGAYPLAYCDEVPVVVHVLAYDIAYSFNISVVYSYPIARASRKL